MVEESPLYPIRGSPQQFGIPYLGVIALSHGGLVFEGSAVFERDMGVCIVYFATGAESPIALSGGASRVFWCSVSSDVGLDSYFRIADRFSLLRHMFRSRSGKTLSP